MMNHIIDGGFVHLLHVLCINETEIERKKICRRRSEGEAVL